MQSPEMQSVVSNPRALQAMMQIQQGFMQLQQEVPQLGPGWEWGGHFLTLTAIVPLNLLVRWSVHSPPAVEFLLQYLFNFLLICNYWTLVYMWRDKYILNKQL